MTIEQLRFKYLPKEEAYRSSLPALKLQEKAVQIMIRKVEKKLKTKNNGK